jgi:hypothetical protein
MSGSLLGGGSRRVKEERGSVILSLFSFLIFVHLEISILAHSGVFLLFNGRL